MKQPQSLQPKVLKPHEKQAIQERMRINVMQVKEQEQMNRERRVQDEQEAQKQQQRVSKSKAQFAHVAPRVAIANHNAFGGPSAASGRNGELPSSSQQYQAPQDDVEITVFVRETERDGGVQKMMESDLLRLNEKDFNSGFSSNQNGFGAGIQKRQLPGGNNNNNNIQQQSQSRQPLQPQQQSRQQLQQQLPEHKPSAPEGHGRLGDVPDYIKQRKAALQAEKDAVRAAVEDEKEKSKHPPGHRPVSEEERLQVLARLEARKLELERDLARLPMRFDTIAVKNRRAEIEKEMSEVEEANRRFSVKKQLYVPI